MARRTSSPCPCRSFRVVISRQTDTHIGAIGRARPQGQGVDALNLPSVIVFECIVVSMQGGGCGIDIGCRLGQNGVLIEFGLEFQGSTEPQESNGGTGIVEEAVWLVYLECIAFV